MRTGVIEVAPSAANVKQYEIEIDPNALIADNMPGDTLIAATRKRNDECRRTFTRGIAGEDPAKRDLSWLDARLPPRSQPMGACCWTSTARAAAP